MNDLLNISILAMTVGVIGAALFLANNMPLELVLATYQNLIILALVLWFELRRHDSHLH